MALTPSSMQMGDWSINLPLQYLTAHVRRQILFRRKHPEVTHTMLYLS